MAATIFGFNVGIELMQLLVVAFTMPWLILLSTTPAHRWVRIAGAVLAGVASVAWIFNRVSGQPNAVEQSMNGLAERAPLGILILASIATLAWLHRIGMTSLAGVESRETENET